MLSLRKAPSDMAAAGGLSGESREGGGEMQGVGGVRGLTGEGDGVCAIERRRARDGKSKRSDGISSLGRPLRLVPVGALPCPVPYPSSRRTHTSSLLSKHSPLTARPLLPGCPTPLSHQPASRLRRKHGRL
jgi:hypothetical protein